MDCTYCYQMNINAEIRNTANINCLFSQSCAWANVELISTLPGTDINILCSNSFKSTSLSSGACYGSTWNMYGSVQSTGAQYDSLSIYCSQYDCQAGFTGHNFKDATVNCDDKHSCNSATINMATTTGLDLRCTNTSACYGANVYCPYRDERSCIIICSSDVNTCNSMSIYVHDSYNYDYLDITCPSVEIHPNSYGCTNLNIQCEGNTKSTEYFTYNYTKHDYECQYGGLSRCCPYFKGTKTVCQPGQDCTINCDNIACSNIFIDGTDANFLNVNCINNGDNDCSNTLIHCPINGCNIKCVGYDICSFSQIVYNGELTDYGTVSINCTDYYSCRSLTINADYANEVNIYCNNGYNQICYSTTLNARYAKTVNLNFNEQYASYGSEWNVNYAETVTLKARGNSAIYSSNLHAENAGSLIIYCSSDSGYIACDADMFFIPYDTTFNCYGDGCYKLTYISTSSILNPMDGLQINMYSCGQCTSFSDCIYQLGLYCNSGNNVDWFHGDDYYNHQGCNSNNCGCNNFINNIDNTNIIFSFSVTDPNCYSPLIAQTCVSGIDCIINCDYNNACINSVIDGTNAKYLTVNCIYSDYCQNTMIICPINGCDINCNSSSVCSNVRILYSGTKLTQMSGENGNISISCKNSYSCSSMIINAQYANAIHIECTGESNLYSEVCTSVTLNGQYAKYAKLNFYNAYASYASTWNLNNVTNIIFNAYGGSSFYSSYIHAENANSIQLNCGSREDSSACISSNYYLPYNTQINCYGDGCYQIGTIYLLTNTSGLNIQSIGCDECNSLLECIGSFGLYCYNNGYQQSSTCYGSSNSYSSYDDCECYNVINRAIYSESKHVSECYANNIDIDNEDCDGDNSDCIINCDYNGKCNDGFIYGGNYNYLTIQCKGEYYCQNTRILCPINGCNIECKYDYSCQYVEIIYPYDDASNYEIEGKISIECTGSNSCTNLQIIADNIYSLSLKCSSGSDSYNYVCNYVSINATNSNKIDIIGNYEYGLANSNIYVNNASEININARGSYGFYTNNLYAMNAGVLSIKCTADEYATAACYSSNWYIPNDTTFNCYGPGCNGLGSIYITEPSAQNIKFNINSCNDCDSKESCLGSLTIYCAYLNGYYLYTEYYYGYSYTTDNECLTNDISNEYNYNNINNCGCNELIKNIKYNENGSDNNCYSPSLSVSDIVKIIAYCVAGIVAIIIICILLRCYQKKQQKKTFSHYSAPNNKTTHISGPIVVKPGASIAPKIYGYQSQPVTVQPTKLFVSAIPQTVTPMTHVKSMSSTADGNNIQLTQVIQSDIPSAPPPIIEEPTPIMPGVSVPSAPPNYNDAPPSYNQVEIEALPAYSDVVTPNQYIPGEGEGRVTNM